MHTCPNQPDHDLASSGPQVVAGAEAILLMGGGKERRVYSLPRHRALHSQTPTSFWGTGNFPMFPSDQVERLALTAS
jgi:hypothetical protein